MAFEISTSDLYAEIGSLRMQVKAAEFLLAEQEPELRRLRQQSSVGLDRFTPKALKVLELALREALSAGSNVIGTEHVLLAILRLDDCCAAQILQTVVEPDEVRNAVVRRVSGPRIKNGMPGSVS